MTSKIAEIRARHQRIETTDDALLVNLEFSWANADRGWLLAEVERLTRELDEARAKLSRLSRILCDPDGNPCFRGSDEDLAIAREALSKEPQP